MTNRWPSIARWGLVLALVGGGPAGCGTGQESSEPETPSPPQSSPPQRTMAITVDDLPIAMPSVYGSEEERVEVIAELTALIVRRALPVTGFVNMEGDGEHPELMPLWRQSGIELGNHTWSHPHLRKVGLEAYLADLEKGHEAVAALAGEGATIRFRYPYLYQGYDPEDRDAIRTKLEELGSPVVPVSIDTSDWYFARGYSEAKRAGDQALAARYRQNWLWNLQESTEWAEWAGAQLFGQEPPQILLLHANELNAEHLDAYLDWAEARGYRFISVDQALADPAYQEPDPSLTPFGESQWLRLRRSRMLQVETVDPRPSTTPT
jgi:peptidoglycan-N-acetylglucosamine deacetylase